MRLVPKDNLPQRILTGWIDLAFYLLGRALKAEAELEQALHELEMQRQARRG